MIDSLVVVVQISLNVHLHGNVWKTFSPRWTRISQHHFKGAIYNGQTSRVVTPNDGLVRVHPSQNGRKHTGFPGFMKHKLPTFKSLSESPLASHFRCPWRVLNFIVEEGFLVSVAGGHRGFWEWKSNFWHGKASFKSSQLQEILSKCHGWKVVIQVTQWDGCCLWKRIQLGGGFQNTCWWENLFVWMVLWMSKWAMDSYVPSEMQSHQIMKWVLSTS